MTTMARLERVLRHIEANLDGSLGLDELSGVAALSPFHFHRLFRARLGIGVGEYVRLLRLRRASYRLAFRTDETVTAIALDSGYESPDAFGRAFRRLIGQSPAQFRRRPEWPAWAAAFDPLLAARIRHMDASFTPGQVRVVDFPATRIMVMSHRGDPAGLPETIRRFIAWRKASRLSPKTCATFNILYGDPAETPPAGFRLDLCVATDRHVPDAAAHGLEEAVLPAGRCAVLRHVGGDDGLGAAFDVLYGQWLPASGEALRDAPPFLRRVLFFPDVPEAEAVLDIFLPLA